MDANDYSLGDWYRILVGIAPWSFLLETLCRALIVYLVLVVVMRLLGKRMSGQVTILDMSITIMLGAVVAPPAEQPDRGLLQGLFILLIVLLAHWAVSYWGVKRKRMELLLHGQPVVLVKDGVLQATALQKSRISRQQLYAQLRGQNIYNLGSVARMYLEAYGHFTLYKAAQQKAGLSMLPVEDGAQHAAYQERKEDLYACRFCGNTAHGSSHACVICGHQDWDHAVTSNI